MTFRTRIRRHLQLRRHDEGGATLVLVAAAMAILLPVASSFAIEIGEDTVVNRSLQSAADSAALDAARYLGVVPDTAAAIAGQAITRNYPGAAFTVAQGSWNSSTGFTSSLSCEATGTCTAVKVTATSSVKHLFLTGNSSLSRSSTAMVAPQAGFSIGTYLTNVSTSQSQVLNTLLGGLGTSVSLSAASYDGLANTYVTVQQLIDASGGVLTPSNALTTTLTGAQWDSFLTSAVGTAASGLSCGGSPTPFPCTAHTALSTLGGSINGSTSTTLCKLVSINGSSCSGGTLSESALDASLNVLQTLTTEGQLANGSSGLSVGTALNLGALASATLVTSLTQPPQVAYGPIGTKATSSQINVNLNVTVLGLGLAVIPLTGAEGTATLASISCSNNTESSTTINASTNAVTNSVTALNIPVSTLTVGGVTNTPLTYTTVPPTTATANAGTNPQTVGTSAPHITFAPVSGVSILSATALLLPAILNLLTTSLGPVLQALGVSVGGAQVADLSTDCAAVSLAQ